MKIFKHLAVGLSLLLSTSLSASTAPNVKETPLIPRELLFGNPEKASPKISPDGTRLAYLAPDSQNVLNIWIRNLTDPASKDIMVTSDHKRGIRGYLWQYDNQHLLYIQDKDGDENWHLYQTKIKDGQTKDLTPYDEITAEIVDYNRKFPNEILMMINHRNKALFDVYRINLQTGESVLDTENTGDVFAWGADNDLQIRVASSYTKTGDTLIRVRDKASSPWRDFLTFDVEEVSGEVVGFSPDQKDLYVLASQEGNTSRLLKFNLATGKREIISEDPQYDLDGVMINPETDVLEAAGVDRERPDWIVLDKTLAPDFERLKTQFKNGSFAILSRDKSDQNWVVASISDQHPTSYYIYHRKMGVFEFLFSTQPALDEFPMSPMKPISFVARDGMKLYGYLTLPVGKEQKNLPTILYVHGGPWVRDSWGFDPGAQWLANRGYAVFQINYRGSTGYGKQYLNAGNREWAGKMHTDLLDGKKWLIDQGISNPEKVAIYGGSYGGYATLVGLTFTPDEFCCGIDVVGPSNLLTLLKTFPAYWSTIVAQMNIRVGNWETEQDFLKSRSPLFKADAIKKPLLIGQGANDPRVKQAESDQIVAAMRENNLPVEYLLFPDEGHGFARPENRLKFYAASEEFLAKYLGGRSQPPSKEEEWESLKR